MEILKLTLDLVLILSALWMINVVIGIREGGVGRAFVLIAWGAGVLGVAHLLETALEIFGLDIEIAGVVHRFVVLGGFVVLIFGFRIINKHLSKTG